MTKKMRGQGNAILDEIRKNRGKKNQEKPVARSKQRWPEHELRCKVDRHKCMAALIEALESTPGRMLVAYDRAEDPASRLMLDIDEALTYRVKDSALLTLVSKCIDEPPAKDRAGLVGQAKAAAYCALGGVWEAEPYNDSWRMWPSRSDGEVKVFQQRGTAAYEESEMASKKKTSKKATAKKKGSVKAAASNGAEPSTGRKGKEPGAKLLAPVKKDSQRGKVLQAGLRKGGADPDELASDLKTTRSSVMSMFHDLNSRSGIGYAVADGKVVATLPKGCTSPWAEAKSAA